MPDTEEMRRIGASRGASDAANDLIKKKKWKEAASLYKQAIDGFPNNREAYYGLAKCEGLLGDRTEQIAWYRKVIYASDPPMPGTISHDGYAETEQGRLMEFVVALSEAGQDKEAYRVYCHATDTISHSHWSGTNYALPLPTQQDYEADPGQITPEHIEAMALVVLATDVKSQFATKEENEALLRRAVALAPHSPVPYFYLGELLHYIPTRQHEAKEAFQKAQQYDYSKHGDLIEKRLKPLR